MLKVIILNVAPSDQPYSNKTWQFKLGSSEPAQQTQTPEQHSLVKGDKNVDYGKVVQVGYLHKLALKVLL